MLEAKQRRISRHKRVRAKISGTKERPRFCVFRSNRHIYTQLIDDDKNITLVAVSDRELKVKSQNYIPSRRPPAKAGPSSKVKIKDERGEKMLTEKAMIAYEIGKLIAKKALEKKIEKVVFDRGGYKYHGVIEALAEGAREGGLKF